MPKTNQDIYQEFTDKIVARLRAGDAPPWRKPWTTNHYGLGFAPMNPVSGTSYRGINVWWLLMEQADKGYGRGLWVTYRQAKQLGGHVRKGEKGTHVILWKPTKGREKENPKTGKKERSAYLLMRTYTVFNVDQCEGIELPKKFRTELQKAPNKAQIDAEAQRVLDEYIEREAVGYTHTGSQAFYAPSMDHIQMPPRESFNGTAEYYSTAFHECGHSTGHTSRLNRESLTKVSMKGDHSYSREELVAEFCAAFLCGVTGVAMPESVENNTAYLKVWASKLEEDPKILIQAAAQAQKAADCVLGVEVTKHQETREQAA